MLRRARFEHQDARNSVLAALRIVPGIVRSMGMCVPSLEAWQALVQLCTEALMPHQFEIR